MRKAEYNDENEDNDNDDSNDHSDINKNDDNVNSSDDNNYDDNNSMPSKLTLKDGIWPFGDWRNPPKSITPWKRCLTAS